MSLNFASSLPAAFSTYTVCPVQPSWKCSLEISDTKGFRICLIIPLIDYVTGINVPSIITQTSIMRFMAIAPLVSYSPQVILLESIITHIAQKATNPTGILIRRTIRDGVLFRMCHPASHQRRAGQSIPPLRRIIPPPGGSRAHRPTRRQNCPPDRWRPRTENPKTHGLRWT